MEKLGTYTILRRQLSHLVRVGLPAFFVVYFLFSLGVNHVGDGLIQYRLDGVDKSIAAIEEHGGIESHLAHPDVCKEAKTARSSELDACLWFTRAIYELQYNEQWNEARSTLDPWLALPKALRLVVPVHLNDAYRGASDTASLAFSEIVYEANERLHAYDDSEPAPRLTPEEINAEMQAAMDEIATLAHGAVVVFPLMLFFASTIIALAMSFKAIEHDSNALPTELRDFVEKNPGGKLDKVFWLINQPEVLAKSRTQTYFCLGVLMLIKTIGFAIFVTLT